MDRPRLPQPKSGGFDLYCALLSEWWWTANNPPYDWAKEGDFA